MFRNKYIILSISLLLLTPLFAQNSLQKKIDSIKVVFYAINPADTTKILRTGNYILNNTTSYQDKFEVLERISVIYFQVNNINKSVAYAFKARDVAEQSADPEMMAQANGSVANLYSYLDLTSKARPYLKQAIANIEKMQPGDKKHLLKALSYLEMGNLDFNDKDYKASNKNYKNSLVQFNLVKDVKKKHTYHYRRSLYNIGNSYLFLKETDSAESYLNKASAVKDATNPQLKYYIYNSLAGVYSMRGNFKRAIDTLQTVLKDPGFDINPLKAEIYLSLSRNYKNTGDNNNYTLYNEKHLALRDTVKGHELKAISTAFDAEQKDFSASIMESKQNNRWLIYSIVAVVLLSISIIIYLNRKKKKEHAIYQLVIKNLKNQVALPLQSETETEVGVDPKPIYSISISVEEDILEGLQKFEQAEGFRNPKLTVSMLAVQLKTNPAYLSAVIKEHKDSNFNTYINELRIRYICQKIHTHREYEKYKISYLAEDCGFTSHSAFSTVFKKVTGISPSAFLREEENSYANQSVA